MTNPIGSGKAGPVHGLDDGSTLAQPRKAEDDTRWQGHRLARSVVVTPAPHTHSPEGLLTDSAAGAMTGNVNIMERQCSSAAPQGCRRNSAAGGRQQTAQPRRAAGGSQQEGH